MSGGELYGYISLGITAEALQAHLKEETNEEIKVYTQKLIQNILDIELKIRNYDLYLSGDITASDLLWE